MRLSARITAGQRNSVFANVYRFAEQRLENAALIATDRARLIAIERIRSEGAAAGLGRLFNALGSTSDLKRGRGVHRRPNGFSASGTVFVRSRSKRSIGALKAYTEGAEIRPVRGRWLWFPTDEIVRIAGKKGDRERVTPGNWERFGLDKRIGPLFKVRSVNGYPLLVVKDASVSAAGKTRSARALTKRGSVRRGQVAKAFIVAFIGIPRTARQARIDINAIAESVRGELPALVAQAMGTI